MFKLGQTVRLIPKDYISLRKSYNYAEYCDEVNLIEDCNIKLGGEYSILEVMYPKSAEPLYRLLDKKMPPSLYSNQIEVDGSDLQSSEKVVNCPYKVGDKVRVRRNLNDMEFHTIRNCLYSINEHELFNTVRTVTAVINHYFITVDCIRDGGRGCPPFYWDDFVSCEENK